MCSAMKKKVIIGLVVFTLIAGTGTGVYAYNQKVQAAEMEKLRVETLKKAEYAVDSLYNKDHTTMLAEDIEKKIQLAEKAVAKVKEEKDKYQLSKEITEVKDIAKIQESVYSTLENGVMTDSVTIDQLNEISQNLKIVKNKNESIYNHLTKYLSDTQEQLTTFEAANKATEEALKTLDRKKYNSALALADKVKNESKKESLKKQLTQVNEKIIAKEEDEHKKAEEARAIAEASTKNQSRNSQVGQGITNSNKSSTRAANAGKTSKGDSTNSNKSTQNSSTNTNKADQSLSKPKTSNKSSSKSNKPSSPSKPSKPSAPSGGSNNSSGQTDWDSVGKQLENHDWSHTDSGEINEGGNTWGSWN